MSEREIVLDQPELFDEPAEALRHATERAEQAEAEVARLKKAAASKRPDATDTPEASASATTHPDAAAKNPPSPSSAHAAATGAAAGNAPREQGHAPRDPEAEVPTEGEAELRKDSMMAHLLDSLGAGKDIGHYGRLVFAMVARHFLPHEEVVSWLTKDRDFTEEQAQLLLKQVEGRDYSPPKRDRILEWQSEQEFPILPHPEDPDCGNLYRNLKFPTEIYDHISHYQEQKAESGE